MNERQNAFSSSFRGPTSSFSFLSGGDETLQFIQRPARVDRGGVNELFERRAASAQNRRERQSRLAVAATQFVGVQKFEARGEALEKILPLAAHPERRMRERAQVARVSFGREDFMRDIAQGVEEAALRVVNEDENRPRIAVFMRHILHRITRTRRASTIARLVHPAPKS